MEKKKIVVIVISIIALIMSIVVIVSTVVKKEEIVFNNPEGSTLIENTGLLKDKKLGDIVINKALLYSIDNISKYTAIAKNTSEKDKKINLYITFYQDDQKYEVLALSEQTIKANETIKINITFEIDLTKATKIEYEIK